MARHVAAINEAVDDGDNERHAARRRIQSVVPPSAPSTRMCPPDDSMEITSVASWEEIDSARSRWSSGGTGTMTIRWDGDLLAGLAVVFDQA
ncbi:MAG TPA: hypothetical protein VK990_01175 [Acidimicrobiia bacterium]|nr:hypothetical protein [Acidimicrobiia bacterium]